MSILEHIGAFAGAGRHLSHSPLAREAWHLKGGSRFGRGAGLTPAEAQAMKIELEASGMKAEVS